MQTQDFKKQFDAKLDEIEARAKLHGLNFTQICAATGISRATPNRWKSKTPKTVELVVKMEQELERAIAAKSSIPGED